MNRLLVAVAVAALLPLAGCSSPGSAGLTVVASVYPLAYVAERIAGDHATVTTLTHPGQEPHDLALDVQQTAEVSDADLVVYEKGFQGAVDEAVDQAALDDVVDAQQVLGEDRSPIPGARPVKVLPNDPHFWLDPRALATVAQRVEAELVALDPDHAEDYRDNGAALLADLVGLNGSLSVALDDCERRTVVVSHDAYGYLGYRYDLTFESVTGQDPEAEPAPTRLADLQRLIRAEGITTIFTEPLGSPAPLESLARDTGVDTAVLDPIEGLTDATADEDYVSLMQRNQDALVEANGCTGKARP